MSDPRSAVAEQDASVRGADELAEEIRRRLGRPPELSHWPLVSIVVLNRDGVEHLRCLLAGLIERTDYPNLEMILVDNASSDESLDYIRAVDAPFPISIVANLHNESFSDANNQGAELASGELLLFLNNDVEPFEPGWLRELVACLRGSGAAATGPTLIHPVEGAPASGYLVHQRGLRMREDRGQFVPAYRDHLTDPLGDKLGGDVETVAIIAACLLIERRGFEAVGGFTHGYWYGPEDVDLMLKLRERGMHGCCSGRSLLIHPPSSTLSTVASEQRREWMRGNRRLFTERWGPRARREFELDRLQGGGLWAEPEGVGATPLGRTRAELEAFGFCLRFASPEGEQAGATASLEGLQAELRRRGHRCLIQRGVEVESLTGLEYDVAVHLKGPCRYAPKSGQLNVLWSVSHRETLSAIECSRYDLVLAGGETLARLRDEGVPPEASALQEGVDPVSVAADLTRAVEARARQLGFRTRIGVGGPAYDFPISASLR